MVTIRDVAARAGVNPSTVSRALKDNPSISLKTKEKVKKAMEELGYVPNLAAKVLASGLTHCVGVVFPPMSSPEMRSQPFYMEILTEINKAASLQDYTISIATGSKIEDLQNQVQRMHLEHRVDGFILLYSLKDDPISTYLRAQKIPFVMMGTPVQFENETTFVDNDNKLMARTAVNYLYDKGHRRILFVTDHLESEVQLGRSIGYRLGVEMLDLPLYPVMFFEDSSPENLPLLLEKIQQEDITALVVIDDRLCLRIMQFLFFCDLRVPDDISLISFNNSIYAKLLHPYLTTFDVNIASLGRSSFGRIFDKIQRKMDENAKVIVPFTLKERESVLKLVEDQ